MAAEEEETAGAPMIPPPPQREHCDHEKMCKFVTLINDKPCSGANCRSRGHEEYDTRSRPHAPAPEQKQCQFYPCGMTLGVGDGTKSSSDGGLFVHGSYESIKAVQKMMLKGGDHDAATLAAQNRGALIDLGITQGMLYEFCGWFCEHNCEESPCKITVSYLHERMEGIKKQMTEHPEYLEKWEKKRDEQKALLRQSTAGDGGK